MDFDLIFYNKQILLCGNLRYSKASIKRTSSNHYYLLLSGRSLPPTATSLIGRRRQWVFTKNSAIFSRNNPNILGAAKSNNSHKTEN